MLHLHNHTLVSVPIVFTSSLRTQAQHDCVTFSGSLVCAELGVAPSWPDPQPGPFPPKFSFSFSPYHLYVLDTSGGEWWYAHNTTEMGYIPSSYVQPLNYRNSTLSDSGMIDNLPDSPDEVAKAPPRVDVH